MVPTSHKGACISLITLDKPVWKEILWVGNLPADTLTPTWLIWRVQGEHKVILLNYSSKENARFSWAAYNHLWSNLHDGVLMKWWRDFDQDPFEYLDQVTVIASSLDAIFAGGAIGFAGYDMIGLYGRCYEDSRYDWGHLICISFVYESWWFFDHKKEKVYVVMTISTWSYVMQASSSGQVVN